MRPIWKLILVAGRGSETCLDQFVWDMHYAKPYGRVARARLEICNVVFMLVLGWVWFGVRICGRVVGEAGDGGSNSLALILRVPIHRHPSPPIQFSSRNFVNPVQFFSCTDPRYTFQSTVSIEIKTKST